MGHTPNQPTYPVTTALAALQAAPRHLDCPLSEAELGLTMLDISCIARLLADLSDQLRMLLADHPTATGHLQQARDAANQTARGIDHARQILACHPAAA